MAHDLERASGGRLWLLLAAAAGVVGLLLVWDSARSLSATYDEVTYLKIGARWWRTGERVGITRMGSPILFWKIQQAPVYWVLDRIGKGALIDDPVERQAELLPLVRIGASWIWLQGLALTAWWARRLNGSKAMAAAAWLYALSPNLIAHGSLITMETPLTTASTAMLMAFWAYLNDGRRRWFWTSAILGGLAFSCKFSVVLFPPILALVWWADGLRRGMSRGELVRHTIQIAVGMAAYVAALLLSDFALTGFSTLPLSPATGEHPSAVGRFGALGPLITRLYETPLPQDWVGFATQMHHQLSGGPSYLLGRTRMTGWWYYYLAAAAVKVPLTFWLLAVWRLAIAVRPEARSGPSDRMLIQVMVLFLIVTAIGSSRNYGFRYLLPLAPLAIVWVSRIARDEPDAPPRRLRVREAVVALGLVGQAIAVAAVHPNELTYFHILAGGPVGGRRILADSNLDWGQGLKSLARLQRVRPEFRDLTFYYFGDTDPAYYGVHGTCYTVNAVDDHSALPSLETARTPYVAVSASLQFGPWAPPGFFRKLDGVEPVALTDDATIAIYRYVDVTTWKAGGQ
ncbi:MAG: glycosyltransferase family 39 protein [Paludisphaera borealis]|uniref:glycosyltransferase family 39 protein n=1 Tax=Paludisphaera borealis TaxID=1387353 RepID=UPI00284A745F|nr:glycosyltransferase family 39 protein [Paludisphaera borealis]MDR3618888.1 glycosyltransferase family 39 protein [Paludisphaera borealis]